MYECVFCFVEMYFTEFFMYIKKMWCTSLTKTRIHLLLIVWRQKGKKMENQNPNGWTKQMSDRIYRIYTIKRRWKYDNKLYGSFFFALSVSLFPNLIIAHSKTTRQSWCHVIWNLNNKPKHWDNWIRNL